MAAVQEATAPEEAAQPEDAALPGNVDLGHVDPDEDAAIGGRWPAPGTIRDRWRADDLAALPQDGLRYEILDGLLIVSPSPANRHQWALVALYELLRTHCPRTLRACVAPFDWKVSDDTVVEPDVFVVPRPAHVDDEIATPLLIAEIASPSTARLDRTIKFQKYADAGVRQYWIVDPGTADSPASVTVFDLDPDTGQYTQQGTASGRNTLAVTGVVDVAVTPDALLDL